MTKYYNLFHFSGPGEKSDVLFFTEELGKISDRHHTTPALIGGIGSCMMTFTASLYKLTNRSSRDFPLR